MTPFILTITAGNREGHSQEVFDGFVIGRSLGHLQIDDPKMSKRHARVVLREGQWVLEDLGSKNQIVFNGNKVSELVLSNGVEVKIGQHLFRFDSMKVDLKNMHSANEPGGDRTHTSIQIVPDDNKAKKNWRTVLKEFAEKQMDLTNTEFRESIMPFNPMIKLTFLSGIQTETIWKLGFGPRKIGPGSTDLTIFSEGLPAICFELIPIVGGALFKTEYSDQIRINGESIPSGILKSGDKIQMGNEVVLVEYVQE